MSALTKESLFSFEVVVDSLFLPEIKCRFPSVAFKLLDFPTLLVYMVEPDIANSIYLKVKDFSENDIPIQFIELKDGDGHFRFKKGKSSLFKMSANMLYENLLSSPLYVMLVDTFPAVPKLLGSCSIGLDSLIESLYDDICKVGLSSPLSVGNFNNFTIYNLMGRAIGNISISYRIMSLGTSLISHIPESSFSKAEEILSDKSDIKSNVINLHVKSGSNTSSADLENDNNAKKIKMLTKYDNKGTQVFIDETQMHTPDKTSRSVENVKSKKISKIKLPTKSYAPEDDGFGFYCPPALFYNSDLESTDHKRGYNSLETEENWDALSNTDTIREEDKYSDEDFDDRPNVKKAEEKLLKHVQLESAIKNFQEQKASLQQFPLLSALLDELSTLQQQPQRQQNHTTEVPFKNAKHEQIQKSVSKNSVERKNHKVTCHKCTDGPTLVPKSKSWIQQEPHNSIKKSKIVYGLTNTQRLRLSKGNREYLQELEKVDLARRSKVLAETKEKYERLNKTHVIGKNSSELKFEPKLIGEKSGLNTIGVQTTELNLLDYGEMGILNDKNFMGNEILHEPEIKPTPTPRKSVTKSMLSSSELPISAFQKKSNFAEWQKESLAPLYTKQPSEALQRPISDEVSKEPSTSNEDTLAKLKNEKGSKVSNDIEIPTYNQNKENEAEASLGADPGEFLNLQRYIEEYSDGENSDAKSQSSHYSRSLNSSKSEQSVDMDDSTEKTKSAQSSDDKQLQLSGLNPVTSNLSPALASNKSNPLFVRRPVVGLSNTVDISASVDSTAHIRASDVHSAVSIEMDGTTSKAEVNDKKPPVPTPRRSVDQHSYVADSVSTFAPSETGSTHSPGPDDGHYISDFESEDDSSSPRRNNVEIVKKMNDLKLDPSAKLGYTWSGSH